MSAQAGPYAQTAPGVGGQGLAPGYNVPPDVKLGEIAYRRDVLFESATRNQQAVNARIDELNRMKRDGDLDPDYDVDKDPRLNSLRDGVQRFQDDAVREAQRHDALAASIRGQVDDVRGRPKRGLPGRREARTARNDETGGSET